MKVGDFVQYRTAMGVIVGYGLVIRTEGLWFVISDQQTGKEEYWAEHLMRKLV